MALAIGAYRSRRRIGKKNTLWSVGAGKFQDNQFVAFSASSDDVDAAPDERHVHTSGLIWD